MAQKNKIPIQFMVDNKVCKKFDEKLKGRKRATVFKIFMGKVNDGEILIDDLF